MKSSCDSTRRAFCLHATALALAGCSVKTPEQTSTGERDDTSDTARPDTTSTDTAQPQDTATETAEPDTEMFLSYIDYPALQVLAGWALVLNPSGTVEVMVIRLAEGLKALLGICTHEGCFTSFNSEVQMHLCPCHGGAFAPAGEALRGPPVYDMYSMEIRETDIGVFIELGSWY